MNRTAADGFGTSQLFFAMMWAFISLANLAVAATNVRTVTKWNEVLHIANSSKIVETAHFGRRIAIRGATEGFAFSVACGCFSAIHWRKWKKVSRLTAGQCVRCGYDLRATPGRCPECGLVTT
jgi:hypothetical protein